MLRGAILWGFFATAALSQTVEGMATNTATSQPVAGVKVAIHAGDKSVGEAETDSQGAFRIEGLKPGEYTAEFSKRGFQPPSYEAVSRKPFRLTASSPVRLEVRMTPLGKIGGRVVDATGAPVADAGVQLMGNRVGYDATTDKQGRFTAADLAPGAYLLWVEPPQGIKAPPARSGETMAWAPTYYPGVTSAGAAGKVEVRAGGEVWDLEIRLQLMAVHRIRGVVLDDRGQPVSKVEVTMEAGRIILGQTGDRERHAVAAEDGSFEFAGVGDGVWSLSAEREVAGVKLRAFLAANMAGHDLERIQLLMSPPFRIQGTVVREVPAGVQTRNAAMLVLLTPDGGGRIYHQGTVDAEGRFTIEGVHPGRYAVRPIPPGAPYYLSSIRLGERELPLMQPVDLISGALPLTVVYKSDGGGVRGTVENCGSATIVFFPVETELQIPELEPRGTCLANGRYEIPGMRPGDYYGFAFDQAPGLEAMFFGFTLDSGLVNQAVRVTVRPGEFTSAEMKVTAR